MKIDDGRLEELIRASKLYKCSDIESAFIELQQLREERRWRKLGVDEPEEGRWYRLYDLKNPKDSFSLFNYKGQNWECVSGKASTKLLIYTGYTHFRPLPMDLPEVEQLMNQINFIVFDEWELLDKAEVEANKRRAKERVREYRQGIRGEKMAAI